MTDTQNSSAPETGPHTETVVADDFKAALQATVRRDRPMYTYARPAAERAGILATARPGMQDPIGHRGGIGPETVVTYNGQEMPVRAAERLGLITKDATGQYVDAKLANNQAAQPAPTVEDESKSKDEAGEDTSEGGNETLDNPKVEQELNSLLTFAQSHGVPPMHIVGEYLANPSVLPASVVSLARRNGIEPASLKQKIESITGEFDRKISSMLEKDGIHYGDLLDWERRNVSTDDINRGRMMAFRGSFDYFRNLAKAYKRHSAPVNAPAGAKYREAKHPSSGEAVTLVTLPGYREMDVRTAARMGLL